jgi:hypothetical protein
MPAPRFKANNAGFYDVRRLPKLRSLLLHIAEDVAADANQMDATDEYLVSSQQGRKDPQGRWRASVVTAGTHAKRANAKHNTLLKALGGAK